MTEAATHSTSPASRNDFDQPADLRELAHVVWRRKILVVAMGVLGGLLGVGLATLSTRYVSEGLLLMPKIELERYKQYEVALGNEARMVEFLEQSGNQGSPEGRLLLKLVELPGEMREAVQPAFTLTDRDARVLGIKVQNPSGFLGARLSISQPERTEARPLRLLAEYTRDTAIKIDLENEVLDSCLQYQTKELELRNLQLEDEFSSAQQQAKVERLRRIVAATPGAAEIDNRQVVSLEKGSERFLSPVAQIVAAEVWIADYELAQIARERELVAAQMQKAYYCGARDLLAHPGTGRGFLEQLKALQAKVLEGLDPKLEIVEYTANAFEVQREKWNSAYLSQMRFVVAPEGAEYRVRKPGRLVGLLGGGILGGVFGVLLALLQAWWRKNREAIVAVDD